MKLLKILLLSLLFVADSAVAHSKNTTATYMGNEAILITSGSNKILFDPLFHNNFGQYQLVPKQMTTAMIEGKAPFDNINAIFISHAHGDHFNAKQMLRFLKAQKKTRLFAPKQAVDEIIRQGADKNVVKRLTAVALKVGGKPWKHQDKGLIIEAVRIPHSGWPQYHTGTENLVFRVTLNDKSTVMHMGDADVKDRHFAAYDNHWQLRQTDTAFPPFWFYSSPQGRMILDKRINAKKVVGVHVPVNVPAALKQSGLDYFSKPGETRVIN